MSTIKVKVKVSTLIKELEKALAEREDRYKNQDKAQEKHEKALEAHHAKVLKLIKAGKGTIAEVSDYYDYSDKKKKVTRFSVVVTFPKGLVGEEPERPNTYHDYEYKRESEEIKQAIRVLKLTEEQYVSASTYASVAKYL